MKALTVYLFAAFCIVLVQSQSTEIKQTAKDEIIAAIKQLKVDYDGKKCEDKKLIAELKRILEVIDANIDEAAIEHQPRVLNFIKEIQGYVMIMESDDKFDPKIFQEFDVFGQSMNPAA
jgi:hypothetical protein